MREWERVPNPEMPVVGQRNSAGVLVVQYGFKRGVGFLKRNPGRHGPPWIRPAFVPEAACEMLEAADARP